MPFYYFQTLKIQLRFFTVISLCKKIHNLELFTVIVFFFQILFISISMKKRESHILGRGHFGTHFFFFFVISNNKLNGYVREIIVY